MDRSKYHEKLLFPPKTSQFSTAIIAALSSELIRVISGEVFDFIHRGLSTRHCKARGIPPAWNWHGESRPISLNPEMVLLLRGRHGEIFALCCCSWLMARRRCAEFNNKISSVIHGDTCDTDHTVQHRACYLSIINNINGSGTIFYY